MVKNFFRFSNLILVVILPILNQAAQYQIRELRVANLASNIERPNHFS